MLRRLARFAIREAAGRSLQRQRRPTRGTGTLLRRGRLACVRLGELRFSVGGRIERTVYAQNPEYVAQSKLPTALVIIDRLTARLHRMMSERFPWSQMYTYLTTEPVVSRSLAICGIEGMKEPETNTVGPSNQSTGGTKRERTRHKPC